MVFRFICVTVVAFAYLWVKHFGVYGVWVSVTGCVMFRGWVGGCWRGETKGGRKAEPDGERSNQPTKPDFMLNRWTGYELTRPI